MKSLLKVAIIFLCGLGSLKMSLSQCANLDLELDPLQIFEPICQIKPGQPNQENDLQDISQDQLDDHFQYYMDSVDAINTAFSTFADLIDSGEDPTVINSIRARIPNLYNKMILHEYYFGNLQSQDFDGGTGVSEPADLEDFFPGIYGSALEDAINRDFGTYEDWQADFRSGAKDDVGWMVLFADPFLQVNQDLPSMVPCTPRRLFNVFITLNNIGVLLRWQPILVMDMYEHAYMIDQDNRTPESQDAYIDAFFSNIDWTRVAARYNAVCSWGESPTPVCPGAILTNPITGNEYEIPLLPNQPANFPSNDVVVGGETFEATILEPQPWWDGTLTTPVAPYSPQAGNRQGGIALP